MVTLIAQNGKGWSVWPLFVGSLRTLDPQGDARVSNAKLLCFQTASTSQSRRSSLTELGGCRTKDDELEKVKKLLTLPAWLISS